MKQKELTPVEDLQVLGDPPYPLRGLRWPTVRHWGLRQSTAGVYFPFLNSEGKLVGWSVRRQDRQPKYLNSPGFRKSGYLYGLYENQQWIKERREVILVEGQFDALAVWDAGFPNVCSTLGCSLAKDQARLLLPWVDRLRILYDGDKAGREGATDLKCKWEGIFGVELLYLPADEDPCSVGSAALQKLIAGFSAENGEELVWPADIQGSARSG
jgi:DNA primase